MSDELPPVLCDDESTWRHKGEKIDLPRLLQLIEDKGTPQGLDLHGCDMSRIDARPEVLLPYAESYRREHGPKATPPWLTPWYAINLGGAHLEMSDLKWARLDGADLASARAQGADLYEANLHEARLSVAKLKRANLVWANLRAALLTGADLRNADLYAAYLQGAELWGARLEGALWCGAHLDRTRLRREQLGPVIGDELAAKGRASYPSPISPTFHNAREAYLALKTNFESIGRYDDAAWAYVKERRMEKAALFGHLNWQNSGSWLFSWLADALAGYGEHWWKPLLWAAVVIAVFAGIYAGAGNVAAGEDGGTHNVLTAFTHSIAAFATVGFNTLEPQGWGARLLTAIEAMLGIGLFALFIFTLGNRMRRS